MKIVKKIYEIVATIVLILLICFLNIGTINIIMNNMDYLQFSKYLSYYGGLFLVLYIIGKIINKEKPKPKDFIILMLGILAYLSYHFAFNKDIALNGVSTRNEGLWSILTYYTTFLVATMIPKKNQKIVMYTLLLTGIFQIIVGTIQTLRITNIFGYDRSNNWSTHFKFASGTVGNPNFYSTYILMCLMYAYGSFLKSKKISNILLYLVLAIIFIYGLIIGNTTSCILAFFIIVIITLLKKINKQNIKKIICGTIIIIPITVLGVLILDNYTNHRITKEMNNNIQEIKEIFETGITDETGNYRIYIWKETLKRVPKYIYTGIGLDNFSMIDDGKILCAGKGKNYQCFDKAHNEYLQKLITEGIFSILIYILLIIYTIYTFYKNKKYKSIHYYALFLSFIGYLIQAFFNISVIPVAPIFYLIMGFLNSKIEIEDES